MQTNNISCRLQMIAAKCIPRPKCSIFIVTILLFASQLDAQNEANLEDSTKVTVEVSYFSRYIWRGFDLNNGHPIVQPSVSFAIAEDFSVDLLSSVSVNQVHYDEADVTLRYETELFPGRFDVSVALSSNHYFTKDADIVLMEHESYINGQEMVFGLSIRGLPLEISFEYGRGLSGINSDNTGNYAQLSLEKELDLYVMMIKSKISSTYLDEYNVPSKITDISFENFFDIEMGSFAIQPNIRFVHIPLPQLLNENDESNIFILGIGISRSW